MGICTREYYTRVDGTSVLSGTKKYIMYVAGHIQNYKIVRIRRAKGGMHMYFYRIVHMYVS